MRELTLMCIILALTITYCNGDDECTKKTSHLAPIRLKKDLLCDYDKGTRPVVDITNTTNVTIRMMLKFFSYEMHSNTISIHNWLVLMWKDAHLTWDPSKYNNMSRIYMPSSDIWTPDLSIYNRNDESGDPSAMSTTIQCLVTKTGIVVCVSPNRHDALCQPNLSKYPFDKQKCVIRFGSWTYSNEELNFIIPAKSGKAVALDDYMENGEWKLLSATAKKDPGVTICCPNSSFPSINYSYEIERHSASYGAMIIIPALVVIVTTLSTLWMNPANFDRLSLSYCNLICHFLYLQILTYSLPSTGDDPPLIIVFGRDSFLLCTFALVLTIALKGMVSSNRPSPNWICAVNSGILKFKPGQIFLLYDTSLRNVATAKGEEDSATIISSEGEAVDNSVSKDWALFAKLIDRLSFIAFFITYFRMFVCFLL